MTTKCPDCQKTEIIYNFDKGEVTCKNCGLVIEEAMPYFEEYREGTSKIPTKFKKGNIVKEQWLMDSKEKNISKIKPVINFLASKLKLPEYVKDDALKLYEEALYKAFCKGRSSIIVAHACVYLSCIIHNLPKTATEITEDSEIDAWKLLRAYKLLNKHFKIATYNPADLLPRFVSKLNLSQKTLTSSIIIMNKIENNKILQGKNPKSIIAAVIYLSALKNNEKITQREVANKVEVMEKTIRGIVKDINRLV